MEGDFFLEEAKRPGELMPVDEDEHGTYIMNSKDLRAIELLRELREAGVVSFKIEGRSKSEYYLSLITKNYRLALDDLIANRPFNPKLIEEVQKTANRGFTTAFLVSNSNHDTERFDSPQEQNLPQVYAGKIRDVRGDGMVEVEVKNRIELGDEVEYISPSNQYRFKIGAIEDRKGMAVSVAHGGNGSVWIAGEGPVEPYSLLSLVKKNTVAAVAG